MVSLSNDPPSSIVNPSLKVGLWLATARVALFSSPTESSATAVGTSLVTGRRRAEST